MTAKRRLLRLPLALVLTAGLVMAQAGAAHAASAGRDGRIAFWDFMTGQIYAVNPDGTGLAQLTHVAQGHMAAGPAWSPDGRHIAFYSDMSGAFRLWIMDANGSHAHMVAGDRPNAADILPAYTPDGRGWCSAGASWAITVPSTRSGSTGPTGAPSPHCAQSPMSGLRCRPTASRSPSAGAKRAGSPSRST